MKIGFVSLGCPKNLVDSEVMLGLAEQDGHEITPDASQADVLVVNTCAFIDRAKQESIDTILEMAELKKQAVGRKLIVTGCLAERYRDELKKEIPEIDAVLGTGEVEAFVGAVSGAKPMAPGTGHTAPVTFYAKPPVFGVDLPTYIYDADTPRKRVTPGHYSYIKIAEGCDYTCAFCIIPTLRGEYRSRDVDSIVREAEQLAAQGVKEVLLISQDSSFFGIDRKEKDALATLLRRLNAVDGLSWIRILYLYPTTITDAVLHAVAECAKVCKYIDLPLQHASAEVLRRMRRPGNRETYDKLLARIRATVPDVTLRTTFIVGFPGETEQDFEALCDFVKATGFDHVGVFTYSHEEDTRAYAFEDDVPAEVKADRRNRLMALQKSLVAKKMRAMKGRTVRVMVDGPSPDMPLVLQGRLEGQAPDIDAVVYLDEGDPEAVQPGQIVEARVTGAKDYDLVASLLI